jgi:hypothetical protein
VSRELRRGGSLALLLLAVCAGPSGIAHRVSAAGSSVAPPARLTTIVSPAGPGSREPNLAVLPDGRIVMSWMEPRGDEHLLLRTASFDGKRWTAPVTIAEGDSFFANWADFPSVRPLGGQRLAAHWLWKSGLGTYSYDVRVSQSDDGGRTWSRPITPHRDETATEHGFVSLIPAEGGVRAVWLDGRKSAGHEEGSPGPSPDMTLRSAVITGEGEIQEEAEIDPRVCDCCQTAAVSTDRGFLVAYRDRSPEEIRDIYLARLEQGRWTAPYPLHADGWSITGCPVNGPALDARGSRVAAVWYSAAGDTPRVQIAFSDDAGATFDAPVRVDEGSPLGRVDVTLLEDRAALAVWLEVKDMDALVRARRISRYGQSDAAFMIARTSAARASGFPQVARGRDGIVFAWTEVGKPPKIHVSLLVPSARHRREGDSGGAALGR